MLLDYMDMLCVMAAHGVEAGRAFGQKIGVHATGPDMFADEARQKLLASVLEAQKKATDAVALAKCPREEAKEAKQGGRPPRGGGDQRQRGPHPAYQQPVYGGAAYQAPAYAAPPAYSYGQGLVYASQPPPVQFAQPAPAPGMYAPPAIPVLRPPQP